MTEIDTSPAAIAALMDGVLPGPWDMSKCQCGSPWCNQYIISNQGPVGFEKVDANFIAAARELVPALAAERDALSAENASLRAESASLREELRGFLALWAVQLAKQYGWSDGELHPEHYDRLKELGARMDDFRPAPI